MQTAKQNNAKITGEIEMRPFLLGHGSLRRRMQDSKCDQAIKDKINEIIKDAIECGAGTASMDYRDCYEDGRKAACDELLAFMSEELGHDDDNKRTKLSPKI